MPAKEYAEIKAGVSGLIGDAPEAPDAPDGEFTVEPREGAVEGITDDTPPQDATPAYGNQTPSNQPTYYAPAQVDSERIHEVAEAIVNERWEEFLAKVGDISIWKERTETNIISIKQEIVRINQRFDNLQNAILGKIHDYDQGMKDVHTEMKALEKVFEKILEPLVSNIKELGRITQDLKQGKK
ncbi:MAG: hypothetical protein WC595_04640 [Candidatus Nanoarchaeia archaeon]